MYNFTIPMALMDFVPVFFFGVTAVILLRDLSVLNPMTLICSAVIVVCGICAATDLKKLLGKKGRGEG